MVADAWDSDEWNYFSDQCYLRDLDPDYVIFDNDEFMDDKLMVEEDTPMQPSSAIWVFSDMYRGWVYLSWKGSDAKLVLGWAVKTWSISSFGVFLVQHKGDWACGTTSLLGYFGGRCTRWARVKGLLMPAAGLVLLWNVFPYLGWGLLAAMRGFCGSVVDAYGSWVVLVTPKTPKHHAVSVSGLGWIASWSGPLFWLISGCFRDWAQRWIGIYLAYWASKMGPGRGSSCLCCRILAVLVAISGLSNLSYTGGYASLDTQVVNESDGGSTMGPAALEAAYRAANGGERPKEFTTGPSGKDMGQNNLGVLSNSRAEDKGQQKELPKGVGGSLREGKIRGGFDFSRAVNGDKGKGKGKATVLENKESAGITTGNRYSALGTTIDGEAEGSNVDRMEVTPGQENGLNGQSVCVPECSMNKEVEVDLGRILPASIIDSILGAGPQPSNLSEYKKSVILGYINSTKGVPTMVANSGDEDQWNFFTDQCIRQGLQPDYLVLDNASFMEDNLLDVNSVLPLSDNKKQAILKALKSKA
ncbi:hypothetical protein E3N88_13114 [Mikania micrantha]|uniref:Uncharacterized protein n=1 Tax=Mikania micrantha TaxID=192012 RepID=A0A5N6P7N8_9ASTR|nr:hypothetical protein E3N88_13114 [Mikania micrantha]